VQGSPFGCNSLELGRAEFVRNFREASLRKWQAYHFMEFKIVFALSLCSTCCSGKGYITTKFQLTFFISLLYFGSLQKTFRHPPKRAKVRSFSSGNQKDKLFVIVSKKEISRES